MKDDVVVNLLTNAVQAMHEGGKFTVIGKRMDGKSVISIYDTGVGVSEEKMRKLFTPLFTTKAKGTGLGLAVCKRIIDAHQGEIKVDSEEGKAPLSRLRYQTLKRMKLRFKLLRLRSLRLMLTPRTFE